MGIIDKIKGKKPANVAPMVGSDMPPLPQGPGIAPLAPSAVIGPLGAGQEYETTAEKALSRTIDAYLSDTMNVIQRMSHLSEQEIQLLTVNYAYDEVLRAQAAAYKKAYRAACLKKEMVKGKEVKTYAEFNPRNRKMMRVYIDTLQDELAKITVTRALLDNYLRLRCSLEGLNRRDLKEILRGSQATMPQASFFRKFIPFGGQQRSIY